MAYPPVLAVAIAAKERKDDVKLGQALNKLVEEDPSITVVHNPDTHAFLKKLQPVDSIGELKQVVDAVLFLTDATFTSGEILHVDGGAHAGKC